MKFSYLLISCFVQQDSFEQMLKLQRMLVGHPEIVKAGRVSETVGCESFT